MKIESLRLKGFIGIQKGLGLDEISVGFRDLSGLVAFDGMNGCGKTTVLENLHPFPQLASRDGALFHHCFLRNSEKELSFSYGGHQYRTLLKIDCQSEKQEGYVWKDGDPQVNGKISEYSKYIRNLLGSPDLFFSSVFCAQNSKKLSDMTTGKLKELFAEFLRLDRLQGWEDTAKQCATVMNGQVGQVDARIAALTETVKGASEVDNQLARFHGELDAAQKHREIMAASLAEHRKSADALKEVITKSSAMIARKADLERTIARMNEDMAKENKAAEGEIESLKVKYRELSGLVQKCDAVLTERGKIEGAAVEEKATLALIETLQKELDRVAGEYEKAKEEDHVIRGSQQEIIQELKALDDDAELRGLREELANIDRLITDQERNVKKCDPAKDADAQILIGKINAARQQLKALELKDPECLSTTCSFITAALAAKEQIPALEKELDFRNATLRGWQEEAEKTIERYITEKREKASALDHRFIAVVELKTATQERIEKLVEDHNKVRQTVLDRSGLLDSNRGKIKAARQSLEALKILASRVPEIAIAEARKQDLEKQLAEVKENGTAKRVHWERRQRDLALDIGNEQIKLYDIDRQIDAEAEQKLKTVNAEIKDIETVRIPGIEKEIQTSREKIAQVKAELDRIAGAEKELESAKEEKERLAREVSEWTYLKNACGKTGLQALEIDGAAPLISAKANELLSMAFGPLFTVKFRTQDEEGREVLDIMTIGEDGEEVLLENLSGGQKVWILKALRLAMTLLSKEKSGRNFETFFSDEEDGALDVDNARNFIALYQSFMKMGGFATGIFISHKPECRAFAANVLKFETGKQPYWG